MEHIKDESNLYLYFVLADHLCRVKLDIVSEADEKNKSRKPPPIETLLCFPDRDLPIGMGAFTIDSKIYLLGGEIMEEGYRFNPLYPNLSFFKAFSDRVILFNHNTPNIFEASPMKAPKSCPQVAVVDNKVYVLAGMQYCYFKAPTTPMFSYYDLHQNIWQVLPDPPFYSNYKPTLLLYASVIGRKIIVRCQIGVYTYDVDKDTWSCLSPVGNSPYDFCGRVADKSDEGIVVVYTTRGAVAYLNDNLDRCQVLEELNINLPSPNEEMQVAFVSYLGDHRFCIFLSDPCVGDDADWLMHVLLFRLDMLEEEDETGKDIFGKDFCRVSIFFHYTYHPYNDITKDMFDPTHAFIVRETREGFDVAEGKVGLQRTSSVDKGRGITLLKSIQTSTSAKRNEKKEERRSLLDNVSEIEASSSTIAPEIEGLNISSNDSTITGPGLSSNSQRIEEINRKLRALTLGRDEKLLERLERLYKKLIVSEHGTSRGF